MAEKLIKVVCNLTGTTYYWNQELVDKRMEYYGDMVQFLKFYVQSKIARQIIKGKSLKDLAKLFDFTLDTTKELYYKELVAFHLNKAKEQNKGVRKQSTTTNIETDDEVADFISQFRDYMMTEE